MGGERRGALGEAPGGEVPQSEAQAARVASAFSASA